MTIVPPGATVGIIGGGQLGRMLAIAAAQLGYRAHILDPDTDCCAGLVAAASTVAEYDDEVALGAFARAVDVATFEFESIAAGPLARVAEHVALFPPISALEIAQDRTAEKRFAADQGARTAAWADIPDRASLEQAVAAIGTPAILKTTRFGYDGKGQACIDAAADAEAAWNAIGGNPAILEARLDFAHEFSILVARGQDGASVTWDAPHNVHADGILATSTVPPPALVAAQATEARATATRIADALGYVGVLAVEFFATADGPVFNEMAPRVHNSGHWTIEGARTSQFENHIRAICGLPLGPTELTALGATMHNLIGAAADNWQRWAVLPGAHLHLYAKGEPRPGRKMGHVTIIS